MIWIKIKLAIEPVAHVPFTDADGLGFDTSSQAYFILYPQFSPNFSGEFSGEYARFQNDFTDLVIFRKPNNSITFRGFLPYSEEQHQKKQGYGRWRTVKC
jgi:hypothetical protein